MDAKSKLPSPLPSTEWLSEAETRSRLWVGRIPTIILPDCPPTRAADGSMAKPTFWLEEYVHAKFLKPEGTRPERRFRATEVEELIREFAWHEAGHAVIGEEYGFKSEGVSILPYDLVGPRS
jgi:hypothetical protein